MPADQPFKPWPPEHRWRYSPGVRLLAFGVAAVAVMAGFVALGRIGPVAEVVSRHWWLARLEQLVAVVVAFAVLLWVEQRRPVELAPRRWTGLGWGMLLGAGLCVTVFAILLSVGSYRVTGLDPGYPILPALISTGLVAAVAEEIGFRGVLFRLSEDLFGTWTAVAISAAAFGLAHLINPGASLWGALAIAVEAGVLFAAVYVVTRSLWWCIGLHFSWNMLQGPLFGSSVSGSGSASGLIRAQFSGPAWLTGGGFGVEASVVTAALMTAVAVVLLARVRREKLAVSPAWTRRRRLVVGAPLDPGSGDAVPPGSSGTVARSVTRGGADHGARR